MRVNLTGNSRGEDVVRLLNHQFDQTLRTFGILQSNHGIWIFRAHDRWREDDGQIVYGHLIATGMLRDFQQMFAEIFQRMEVSGW